MEYVHSESARKAFRIFLRLLEKSEMKKSDDPALFNDYDDPEVSHLMHLLEEEAGIMIIRAGDILYYSPHIDNRLLGFTNEELRNALRISNNTELYVVYIIILAIIIKFYNGENYNNKCRTMLKVEELENYITQKMENISQLEEEEREKVDRELSYNFSSAARFWLNLPAYDEKIVQYSLSTGTRISYIFKTIRFLREQGLVNIDNENEIFTTSKMDALIMGYYPENTRKKEILSFIEGAWHHPNNVE
ncbi:MAG: hypothetical protein HPY74_03865 [Firmicutes bacterium]|nr:hypothetical protein [Bacillota bacterium]